MGVGARGSVDLIRKVDRRRLSDDIVEQIGSQIRDGGFHSGERLPSERELAERFGVSRSIVRESLRVLESLGMVRVRPGVGTLVIGPGAETSATIFIRPADAIVMLDVLKVVSSEAAARAATRISDTQVEHLERILEGHRMAAETTSTFQAANLDKQFHDTIFQVAGSDALQKVGTCARAQLGPNYHGVQTQQIRMSQAIEEHESVLAAFKARNGGQAASAMRVHMERSQEAVRLLLVDRLGSSTPAPSSGSKRTHEGDNNATF